MFDDSQPIAVGRVAGLWRYPVKSMAAEPLDKVDVSWHGIEGDRRWAFVRRNAVRSGFPWFTLRQLNNMNKYVPTFADPSKPDRSKVAVTAPSGDVFDVDDLALGDALCPEGAQVIKQDRGVFDTFPLSLITTQTVARLGKMVDDHLDVLRFRPNILVEAEGEEAFLEDTWVGNTVQIGSLRMRVDQRDSRCVVITIDPVTGERNADVLRTVTDQRKRCLGVYGSTVEPGSIRLGDQVRIEE